VVPLKHLMGFKLSQVDELGLLQLCAFVHENETHKSGWDPSIQSMRYLPHHPVKFHGHSEPYHPPVHHPLDDH
jgi:hypothetical protein